MTGMSIKTDEFHLLRELVERECGISIGIEKKYLFETRLLDLLLRWECKTFRCLHDRLAREWSPEIRDSVIDAVTTNETTWFRDRRPYEILRAEILPALATVPRRPLRIWSAAGSTGQEPYSVAMTIRDLCASRVDLAPRDFEIVATDISDTALATARAGRYGLMTGERGLRPAEQNRWFVRDGKSWVLDPSIRAMVGFRKFNLQEPFGSLGRFDVVLLRNVAIYLNLDCKRVLLERMARVLHARGVLFLGATESLHGVSTAFELVPAQGTTYYRRR